MEASIPVPPRPLGEAWIDSPRLRVQLMEVQRVGPDVIAVSLVVTNRDQSRAVALGSTFAAGAGDEDSIADVFVLDEGHHKKYFVLRDGQGRPACSRGAGPMAPGEQRTLWCRLSGPSAGVDSITVVVPHAAPFSHVAIAPQAGR